MDLLKADLCVSVATTLLPITNLYTHTHTPQLRRGNAASEGARNNEEEGTFHLTSVHLFLIKVICLDAKTR